MVLIAAVTVNCLMTAINGKAVTEAIAVPYIDMLLPPLQDVQDNSKDAATKINDTAKATTAYKATTTTTITTTTSKPTTTTKPTTTRRPTTKKPTTNHGNIVLPELSIEALLPPLFEAKIEKGNVQNSTTTTAKTTTTTTTTTTTQRPTTKTTKAATTTANPSSTTTTTLKPSNLKVPDLFLDPFLPPLLGNDIVAVKDETVTTTTQKPITTTKKNYQHQQQTHQFKDQSEAYSENSQKQQQQLNHIQPNTATNEVKTYKKPAAFTTTAATDKHVAESQTHPKQVSLTSQQQNVNLQSKTETVTQQYVAKQKPNKFMYNSKQLNYSFDLYLGSTTTRPAKDGLPTITPFPHRLGR